MGTGGIEAKSVKEKAYNPHEGHRKRILAKLEKDALEEHEYLEALLFYSIPRKNTNEIAHRLLATFNSIKGVFDASMSDLQKVEGIGVESAGFIHLLAQLAKSYRNENERSRFPKRFVFETFKDYAYDYYIKQNEEVFDFYLLDKDSFILERHRFTSRAENFVEVAGEKVVSILNGASVKGLAVVHNHLKGNCAPSEADNLTTKRLQILCEFCNIIFCDHIIVSPVGVYSYYHMKKLEVINREYSSKNLIEQMDKILKK